MTRKTNPTQRKLDKLERGLQLKTDPQRLMKPTPERLLKVAEVAKILAVSTRQVWKLVEVDEFVQPFRIAGSTRWRESEVQEFLAQLRPEPEPELEPEPPASTLNDDWLARTNAELANVIEAAGIVIPPPELTVAERENWTLEHQIRGILRLCPETVRPERHSAGDLIEAANYLRDLIEAQTVQVCRERDGFAARVLELEVSDCEISALEERAERAETKLQRNGARLVEFMEAIRLPEDERQAAILAMGHGPAAEGSRETQEDPA